MTTIKAEALIEQLQWRYATKKFDSSKKIPAPLWSTLEQALVLSPSSFGLQLWKFYVINDAKVREQLKPASWNQSQITDASHLVVFAAKNDPSSQDVEALISSIMKVRGAPASALEEYKGMMNGFVAPAPGKDLNAWAARQVYIALGFFLSSAAMLGIDACPMEGFSPADYNKILGLEKEGYTALVVATAGYRASDDGYAGFKKVRFDASEMIKHI